MKKVQYSILIAVFGTIILTSCVGRLRYVIDPPIEPSISNTFIKKPELLWEKRLISPPTRVTNYNDSTELVLSYRGEIYYYDLNKGDIKGNVWQPFREPIVSSFIDQQHLITGAVKDRMLVAYDFNSHKKLWRKKLTVVPNSLTANEKFIFLRVKKEIVKLDRFTGDVLQRKKISAKLLPGLFSIQSNLFILTESGALLVYNSDLEQVDRQDLDIGDDNVYSFSDDKLLIGDSDGKLVIYDYVEKNVKYKKQFAVPVFSKPVMVGDIVFIGLGNGKVVAINIGTGDLIWEYSGTGLIDAPLLITDRVLLVPYARGAITALDIQSGNERWKYQFENVIRSIHINADKLLVIDRKKYMHCLKGLDE